MVGTGRRAITCFALAAAAIVWGIPPEAGAAPGDFDATFGNAGATSFRLQPREAFIRDDHSIVLAEGADCTPSETTDAFVAIQLLESGSLDPRFSENGRYCRRARSGSEDRMLDAALSGRGDLVMVGRREFPGESVDPGDESWDTRIVRLTTAGLPDRTFGRRGVATFNFDRFDSAFDVLPLSHGRLMVAEAAGPELWDDRFFAVRLERDGSVDRSFGNDGRTSLKYGPDDMYRLSGGRVLFAGHHPLVLNPDGTRDRSYGTNGNGQVGPDNMVAGDTSRTPDGGYLYSGQQSYLATVAKWTSDGFRDRDFGDNGVVRLTPGTVGPDDIAPPESDATAIAVDAQGRILVEVRAEFYDSPGCSTYDYEDRPVVMRLLPSGAIDRTFGDDGTVFTGSCDIGVGAETALTIQPWDGNILAGVRWGLIRLGP